MLFTDYYSGRIFLQGMMTQRFLYSSSVVTFVRSCADSLYITLKGKPTEESKAITVKQYGELKAADFVPGTEV